MQSSRHKGRSARTYENKKRKLERLYNSNANIQKKYPSLDTFLALLKKPTPSK